MTPVFVEGLGGIGSPLPHVNLPPNPASRHTGPAEPAAQASYPGATAPGAPAEEPTSTSVAAGAQLLGQEVNAPGRRLSRLEGGAVLAAETALNLFDLLELQEAYLGLLEAGLPAGSESMEAVEDARRLARRIRDSVAGILSEMREGITDMEYVDLTAVMSGFIPDLVREAGDNVRLRIAPGSGPIPLQANPPALLRAVIHLVRNAREASPRGAEVRISWGESRASSSGDHGGPSRSGFARVRVEDRGPGIPSRFLPWVFTPFFSLHERSSGGHTGLGLPVVRSVIEGHGGWVEVTSTPGSGTVVDLFLPLEAQEAQRDPGPSAGEDRCARAGETIPAAQGAPEALESLKALENMDALQAREARPPDPGEEPGEVLIVEEDRLLSGLVERVLVAEGYHVRVVRIEGGRAAADASDASPSLLLVERTLPGGRSGEEFLSPWRERFPDARVLLLDWSEAGPIVRREGEPPILRRPFEPARILSAVQAATEPVPGVAGERPAGARSALRPH